MQTEREAQRQARSLAQRETNLRLSMVPLRRKAVLSRAVTEAEWKREPDAVGFNPDGSDISVWQSREVPERKLVVWHTDTGEEKQSAVLRSAITPTYVQALPNNRALLVHARSFNSQPVNAQVWDSAGALEIASNLDDAIEHVVAMRDGSLWVGYFDEAHSSRGPGGHGLARFKPDLALDWAYPFDRSLPDQFDCMALNVASDRAWTCSYTSYRLAMVSGTSVTDHGAAPHRGAGGLLIQGDRGALLGGYGPDYDLIVPFQLTRDGVAEVGNRGRVVMPDGLEIRSGRWSCRAGVARQAVRSVQYELTLDAIFDALVPG